MKFETNQENEADIIAVIGATGSGKGVFIKKYEIKKSEDRILYWDYMREYSGMVDLSTHDLAAAVRALKNDKFKVAFLPSYDNKLRAKQFDVFCNAAYLAGYLRLVIEELSFVTMPSWAPSGWQKVCSIGRHRGLRVIGCSQRPAQVDKTFWSNCTEIHVGFMNDVNDQKTMAKALGLTIWDVEGLKPMEYFHKNVRTKEIKSGKVVWRP